MKKIYLLLAIFLISIPGFGQNEIGSGFDIVAPGYQVIDIEFDLEIENATYNGIPLDTSIDDYRVTVYDETNDKELKNITGAPFDNGELTIEDIIVEDAGLINISVNIQARFGGFTISENIDLNVFHNKWTGEKDGNWHDPDNWVQISIPLTLDDVIIADDYTHAPVIYSDDAEINSLQILSGAGLTIRNSKELSVGESVKSHGTLTKRQGGTLIITNNATLKVMEGGSSVIGGDGIMMNNGYVILEDGGFLMIRSTGILTNSGVLNIYPGGQLENNGTLTLRVDAELTNNGDLSVEEYGELSLMLGAELINSGTVTIHPPGGILTSEGTITNNSGVAGLILKSNASGSATFIHDNSGVEATVERYIAGAQTFHLVSTPVSGQSIQHFLSSNHGVIAYNATYNIYAMQHYKEEPGGWSDFYPPNQPGNVEPGVAYGVGLASPGTVVFQGTLVHDDRSVNITRVGSGWNGIGNPFASALNVVDGANSFLSKYGDQLDPEYYGLYVWDPVAGHYKIINSVPGLSQNHLASNQGFIVRAKDGGGTVVFETNMREHENPQFRKEHQESGDWHHIVLQAENNNGRSLITSLAFNKNMTTDFDIGYDAGYFTDNHSFSFYSRLPGETTNTDLAIQALPELWNVDTQTPAAIPLGVEYAEGGKVTFSAAEMTLPGNVIPMLEDTQTGTLTNLAEEKYTADIAGNGEPLGRFYVYMQPGKEKSGADAENKNIMQTGEKTTAQLSVFPNPARNKFNVVSNDIIDQVRLINISGQVIIDIAVNAPEAEINVSNQRPGIYLMQIRTGEKIVTRRVQIAH